MAYPNYYQNYYGAVPDMLNQQKMPYQMQQAQMPMQMPSDPLLWVLGEVEAMSYPVAPNNTVVLWDKNEPVIYVKSANMQGVPSIKVLDFTERQPNAPERTQTPQKHECKCGDKFILKEDFNALQNELATLRSEFENFTAKQTTKSTKSKGETVDG
ncbi:MAG: hypothetical protein IJ366_00325 [Clostridia bacterium]|nr:hypothetical protein [Clostridia bacterium]